jgi:hypothetical protein
MPIPSPANLPELIAALPAEMQEIAHRLLSVERMGGQTVPPPEMTDWIVQHFGGVEQVREQTIIRVTNLATLDSSSFNPLRARRPQERETAGPLSSDATLEHLIAAQAGENDTFRDPLRGTTADGFGRIEGRFCVSASNVAKYDGWHGLVIFNEFHPLRFTRDQLLDYFGVAVRWLTTAHQHDPQARYPMITWNCLWKSGASITHGHMQMTLSRGMASGQVERTRRAAVAYRKQYNRNLCHDLWLLHAALGLDCCGTEGNKGANGNPAPDGSEHVRGYVSLTPIKDREVVLLGSIPDREQHWGREHNAAAFRASLEPLWEHTWSVLRNLIDVQGVRSFNLAVSLPPAGPTPEAWDDMPVRVRLVDRGDPTTRLVNFGAMELFASSVITADPFAVAALLRSPPPAGGGQVGGMNDYDNL